MNTRHVLTIGLAVLLLGSVLGAGIAFASGTSTSTPEASEYNISELKQDGTHYATDSVRIVPSAKRAFWLVHRPTNKPWKQVTREGGGTYLGEDATLKTNAVYLRTWLTSSTAEQYNVTIVYWTQETRDVKEGNTTTTETYAANKQVVHRTVTLQPGKSLAKIDLPQHSNPVRVTMWLDRHPEEARWTFQHHSVATQQSIPINSFTDFLLYGAAAFLVPMIVTHWYGSRKVKAMVEKAGAPPGHSFLYYSVVMVLLFFVLFYVFYFELAELIVAFPAVLGVWGGVWSTLHTLASHEGRADRKMLFQPHIDTADGGAFASIDVPSFGESNDDNTIAFDETMRIAQWATYRFLDEGKKGLSIIRDGKLAFLARLKGGRARVDTSNLTTRLTTPESPSDEMFVIDPKADTLIDYKPPGLALKTPEIEDWRDAIWPGIITLGAGVLAWQTAQAHGVLGWSALLVAAPVVLWKFAVTGTDTYVDIEGAAINSRSVLGTTLVSSLGMEHAEDLEAAEEFAFKAVAQSGQERRDTVRRFTESELDGKWSEGADATQNAGGDRDDEVTPEDVSPVDRINAQPESEEEEVSGDD